MELHRCEWVEEAPRQKNKQMTFSQALTSEDLQYCRRASLRDSVSQVRIYCSAVSRRYVTMWMARLGIYENCIPFDLLRHLIAIVKLNRPDRHPQMRETI